MISISLECRIQHHYCIYFEKIVVLKSTLHLSDIDVVSSPFRQIICHSIVDIVHRTYGTSSRTTGLPRPQRDLLTSLSRGLSFLSDTSLKFKHNTTQYSLTRAVLAGCLAGPLRLPLSLLPIRKASPKGAVSKHFQNIDFI